MIKTAKTRYFSSRRIIFSLKPTDEEFMLAGISAKKRLDSLILDAIGTQDYEAEYEYSHPQPKNWFAPNEMPHRYVIAIAWVNVKERYGLP